MAAELYDKRRERLQCKEHENLVRFALSGLSCMCAATGKQISHKLLTSNLVRMNYLSTMQLEK